MLFFTAVVVMLSPAIILPSRAGCPAGGSTDRCGSQAVPSYGAACTCVDNLCCSQYGFCGPDPALNANDPPAAYCGSGCQSGTCYGAPVSPSPSPPFKPPPQSPFPPPPPSHPPPSPPPPPVYAISQVSLVFCTTSDNKNGGSTATITVAFSGIASLATLNVPSNEYRTFSTDSISTTAVSTSSWTQTQIDAFPVTTNMNFHAGGSVFGDGWDFAAVLTLKLSNGQERQICYGEQSIGAGGGNPSHHDQDLGNVVNCACAAAAASQCAYDDCTFVPANLGG